MASLKTKTTVKQGLTTQCDKKTNKSGDQRPLKKRGGFEKPNE